jgi:hypothetical protein
MALQLRSILPGRIDASTDETPEQLIARFAREDAERVDRWRQQQAERTAKGKG